MIESKTLYGSKDYTPTEAKDRLALEKRILGFLESNGYEHVLLPSLEYLESIKPGLGLSPDALVSFKDNDSQSLVLRPDPTAAIARMAATRLKSSKLLKLSYAEPVFRRHANEGVQEFFQIGVECIGESSIKSDSDLLKLCLKSLKQLGLSDVILLLNHKQGLEGLSSDQLNSLKQKNYVDLGYIPKQVPLEDVNEHKKLAAASYFSQLLDVGDELKSIRIDTALIKDLSYYTGFFFDVIVPGYKHVIASGGRYDQLLDAFGSKRPAVGFAIYLNRLQESVKGRQT